MSADVPPLTADAQVARIFALRRGFNTIHLIDVGIKLGVLRKIRGGQACINALSSKR